MYLCEVAYNLALWLCINHGFLDAEIYDILFMYPLELLDLDLGTLVVFALLSDSVHLSCKTTPFQPSDVVFPVH